MNPTILIFPNLDDLSLLAAELFVFQAKEAVQARGRFLTALSGGSTPQPLYHLLRQSPFAENMPWDKTFIFWGDERLVPPDDSQSSYGLTADHLLNHVPIPPNHIYRALGETELATAIADYTSKLQTFGRPWPRFDLILLGMGHDGHTASLFPGPILPPEKTDPIIGVTAQYDGRPAQRITFTPRLINAAHHILFLTAGASKAQALQHVLEGDINPQQWPAQRIQPTNGAITWLIDEPAAQLLKVTIQAPGTSLPNLPE
ncbi:MAG: 6-phosphogluconolactonase [Chloroflexi bacterium]|nr:6-phosphogluconolactonase [Chloroflexota bacterium]